MIAIAIMCFLTGGICFPVSLAARHEPYCGRAAEVSAALFLIGGAYMAWWSL